MGTGLSVTAHGYVAAALAVVGHVWPLWHGFRGGKGAATGVGGLLVLWPWIVPVLLVAWILVLVTTGYAPHTKYPQIGGNVVWIDPADEADYLASLHRTGIFSYWTSAAPAGSRRE